jgi:hypothetical protein
MTAKLTVLIFILLCLQVGVLLTLLPWLNLYGLSDWGDNYLLALASNKTGMPILRSAVASGWVRGAVTGLGILNLGIAFREMANFNQAVRSLEGKSEVSKNAGNDSRTARLSDNGRNRDEQ